MRERISAAIDFGSRPGAIDFISRRIIPRFCMSARTAAPTPGYCTLTATSRPSSRRARYTCPIEAAAIGTGSKVSKTSSIFSPYSCSITFFMSLKATFGAASRSSASFAWNCSRYSGGTRPTSRNDITCPSFIAAPFIVPRAATICSAVSTWRRASASLARSSSRVRFAARVPSWRAACSAASRPTVAERRRREVGIGSLAMAANGTNRGAPGRSARESGAQRKRRGGVRAQRLERGRHAGRRRSAGGEHRQHAAGRPRELARRGRQRVGLVAGLDRDVVSEARVALEVVDRERDAGLHDVAGDPLVGPEARAEQPRAAAPGGGLEDEVAGALVDQRDRARARVERRARRVGDAAQERGADR